MRQLQPFAREPRLAGISIQADARLSDEHLEIRFEIRGVAETDFHRIALPSPSPRAARKDGLWERTCLECFVFDTNSGAYVELNFSPSGDWAIYSFAGYRREMRSPVYAENPPPFSARSECHDHSYSWVAQIPRNVISNAFREQTQHEPRIERVGLTAVLVVDQMPSYWALSHAANQPDFHRAESFVFTL